MVLDLCNEQAVTPQEESFRMTAVRKAYQKAILAPVHMVEQIWKEYESFENSVSRALVGCLPFNQSQCLGVKQPSIVMHFLWGSIKLKFSHGHPLSGLYMLQYGYHGLSFQCGHMGIFLSIRAEDFCELWIYSLCSL